MRRRKSPSGAPVHFPIALQPSTQSWRVICVRWGKAFNCASVRLSERSTRPVTDSSISQKPAYGRLKKINASTFEYRAKAKYKGSDTFAIKATGQGPKTSGTSVITVHATIK